MKKRKIDRPGVPAFTAQNEQGEDEGIGVNAPVPFVFPRNEPKRVKSLATGNFLHVFTGRGMADVNDVLFNTLGAAVGIWLAERGLE